jgi:hypothetical protein
MVFKQSRIWDIQLYEGKFVNARVRPLWPRSYAADRKSATLSAAAAGSNPIDSDLSNRKSSSNG